MRSETKIRRSCRNKKKYHDPESAQRRANNLWKTGIWLKVYKCSICNGYHLAKVGKQKRLEIAFKMAGL